MKKQLKISLKILSLILCFTILIGLPSNILAKSLSFETKTQHEDYSYNENESEEYEVGNIIGEDDNKRDKYSKQFRLDDGSYMAVSYNTPIHYKNKSGKWVNYDNSIINAKDTLATADEANTEVFTNKSSDIDVKYSKTSKENNMVKIKATDYLVSWGYKNAKKATANVIQNNEDFEGNEKYTALNNLTSEILYTDVYNNVDIQYITTTLGIKENIILKNSKAQSEFEVQYNINSLTAKQTSNKRVDLYNKQNKPVYSIEAPYMTDAKGKTSTQLNLTITEQKSGTMCIKISADKSFLKGCDYPVIIDPQFNTTQDWQQSECTYVSQGNPNTCYGYNSPTGYTGTVYVGTLGSGLYRTYLKMKTLPQLNKGDMIVQATVNLFWYQNDFYQNMDIGAYFATNNWSQSTLTWNNQTGFEANVVDYERFIPNAPNNIWHNWDVTSCVKRWYNGAANNGIMLKALDEDNVYQCASFYSSNYPATSTPRPLFTIVYRNNKGIEDYWSYSSFSVGSAGTAYVNDYSGNLVFVTNDASTSSGYAPASVQHVYNGYMANQEYSYTGPKAGKGWRLNIQESISLSSNFGLTGDALTNFPYVYTDQDGTDHYFYKKTENGQTKYLDEDGLGYELIITTSNMSEYLKIVDDKQNKKVFYNTGRLNYTEDSNGNRVTYTYAGPNSILGVSKITDASNNQIQLTKNNNGYLTSITDPANRTTTYTYSGGKLTRITRSDGKYITFEYDSGGSLIAINDVDGYRVYFTYTSTTSGKKVSTIQEYGCNTTVGQRIIYDRTQYNSTTVTTKGIDGILNTNDDQISTYQFDGWGRTISIKNKTRTADLGASKYDYTAAVKDSSASNIKTLNRVSKNYSTGSNPDNLVANGNMENTSAWNPNEWCGSNTFTSGYRTDKKYFGNKSLYMTSTAYNGDSRARVSQDLNNTILVPGKTYTVSGYVLTQNISGSSNNSGAFICADCFKSDGNNTTLHSDYVLGNTSSVVDNGWQRVSLTFTVPQNTEKTRINLALRAATGTVFFDGIQVEEYSVANNVNLLENSGFEKGSTGWGDEYSNLDSSVDKVTSAYKYSGNNSFVIKGSSDYAKGLKQTVNVSGTEADTYIISGWAKANAVPSDGDTRKFKISVKITYSDGSVAWQEPANFNHSISDWQFTTQAFTLSDGNSATNKTPVSITVCPRYQYQGNYAFFDNICLEKDNAKSYTYNNDGKLVSVVDHSQQQSTMEYSNSDLVRNTDLKGYSYTYDYDNKHNMTKATSQRGVKYNYAYNSHGLATSLQINNTGSYTIKSDIEYDSNGLLAKSTDSSGNEISYNYNPETGTLTSFSDDSGTTNYEYDETTDSITQISKEVDNTEYSVNYDYTNNKKYLSKINHNNTDYNLVYDAFGNKIDSKVGNQSLSEYSYYANNGPMMSSEYGTGQTISYSYGAYENISEQKYNGNTAFRWLTNRSGDVVKELDYVNNTTYGYTTDSTGRTVHQSAVNGTNSSSGNHTWYSADYSYDLNNNITRLALKTSSSNNVNRYEYGQDNLPTRFEINDQKAVTYAYDQLNRLTSTSISTNTPVNTYYSYLDNTMGPSTTTTKIARENINGSVYKYEYDSLGNITNIKDNSDNVLYNYTYDGMSQLICDIDYTNNKKHQYEYDNAGNILSETSYDIDQNGVESNPLTINYSYGDSNWSDKLTAYNGQSITYDEIGNPLSYRDGMTMTWQNGRQLATLQNGTDSFSYSYDSNGVRVKKNANGTEYTYAYINGLLMYETRGEAKFFYSYDTNGILYGVKYMLPGDSTVHSRYFSHNSFGDIIGIYEGGGTLQAKYTYDAWGNVTSIVDGNGNAITDPNHIGNLNPFRYRGYYLDTETGLYYLMSRYYDPLTHRFINADGYFQSGGDILDANMSSYCRNNPMYYSDSSGHSPKTLSQLQNDLTGKDNLSYNITAITAARKQGYSMNDTFIVSNGKLVPYNFGNQIIDTAYSIAQSVEIRAGVGYGMGIKETVDNVEISALIKADLLSLYISPTEGLDFGSYCDAKFSIILDQIGWDNEVFNSYIYEGKSFSTDQGTAPNKLDIFSVDGYFIAGGSVSISSNLDYINKRLTEIW